MTDFPTVPDTASTIEPLESLSDFGASDDQADYIDAKVWETTLTLRCNIIDPLPKHLVQPYAETKAEVVDQLLNTNPQDTEALTQAWFCVIFFDKLVAHSKCDPDDSLNATMRNRMRMASNGEWVTLAHDLIDRWADPVSLGTRPGTDPWLSLAKRIQRLVARGNFSKAATAALSGIPTGHSQDDKQRIIDELNMSTTLCPSSDTPIELDLDQTLRFRKHFITRLKRADETASGGLASSPALFWKYLLRVPDGDELVADLGQRIATGRVPMAVRKLLGTCDIIGLLRPDGRVRPIAMPMFLKKCSVGALMQTIEDEIKEGVGEFQFGVGVPDGTTQAYHTLEAATRANPDKVLVSLDVSKAFPSINRMAAYNVAKERAPLLASAMEHWYGHPGRKIYRGPNGPQDIWTATGVDQGDPMAGPIYALGQCAPLEAVLRTHLDVSNICFHDDTYISVKPERFATVYASIEAEWAKVGLKLNPTKTRIFCPDPALGQRLPPEWQNKIVHALPVLGQHLRNQLDPDDPQAHVLGGRATLQGTLDKLANLHDRLRKLVVHGLRWQAANDIWVNCTRGVTTHLFSTSLHDPTELDRLEQMQTAHLNWIAGRPTDATTRTIATLQEGVQLPNYKDTAPALFVAAQSRLVPETVRHMAMSSPDELFTLWPQVHTDLAKAKTLLRQRGVPLIALPFEAGAQPRPRSSAQYMQTHYRRTAETLKHSLTVCQRAKFTSNRAAETRRWLPTPPEGRALMSDADWRTNYRKRLLLPAPTRAEAPDLSGPPPPCSHQSRFTDKVCTGVLDADGIHEELCDVGGGILRRHAGVCNFLAQKHREYTQHKVAQEQWWPSLNRLKPPTPAFPAGRVERARIDVVVQDYTETHLYDVVVANVLTNDHDEMQRRAHQPLRAANEAANRKRRRYGTAVIPFAVEDTGRLHPLAAKALRRLAEATSDPLAEYPLLVAELQVHVMAGTNNNMRTARGQRIH